MRIKSNLKYTIWILVSFLHQNFSFSQFYVRQATEEIIINNTVAANKSFMLPIEENGFWGIINLHGEILCEPQYNNIEVFPGTKFYAFLKNEKWGLADSNNVVYLSNNYDYIIFAALDDNFITKNHQGIGVYSPTKGVILENQFDDVSIKGTKFLIAQNNSYGRADFNGNIIIPPIYSDISVDRLSGLYILKKNNFIGAANEMGNIIAPVMFSEWKNISNNYSIFISDSITIIIDVDKKQTVSFSGRCNVELLSRIFLVSDNFRNYLRITNADKLIGLHSFENNLTIAPQFTSMGIFDKYLIVSKPEAYGLIDANGKQILDFEYSYILPSEQRNKLFLTRQGERYIYDLDSRETIKISRDDIQTFYLNDFLLGFKENKKVGAINLLNETIYPAKYDKIHSGKYNLSFLHTDGKYRIGNNYGEFLTPSRDWEKGELTIDHDAQILKYYTDSGVVAVDFGENGKILDKTFFKNVMSISLKKQGDLPDMGNEGNYHWARFDMKKRRNNNSDDNIGIKNNKNQTIRKPFCHTVQKVPDNIGINNNLYYTISSISVYNPYLQSTNLRLDNSNSANVDYRKGYKLVDLSKAKICNPFYARLFITSDFEISNYARALNTNDRYILFDSSGSFDRHEYAYIGGFEGGYARVNYRGKLSCIKENRYTEEIYFNSNEKPVYLGCQYSGKIAVLDGNWGVIDSQNKVKIPIRYKYLEKGHKNQFIAQNTSGLWGILTAHNDTIAPFKYRMIKKFIDNESLKSWTKQPFYKIKMHQGWGVLDSEGNIVVKPVYEDVLYYGNDSTILFSCKKDSYWQLIGLNDTRKNPVKYSSIEYITNKKSYHFLIEKSRFGIISNKGELITKAVFDSAFKFSDNRARVYLEKMYFYVNKNGTRVSNNSYSEAKDFSEGMAAVYDGSHWGFIDTIGNTKIDFKYLSATSFINDRSFVEVDSGKYIFINKADSIISDKQYGKGYNFCNELAIVSGKSGYGIIDTSFKWVVAPRYKEIEKSDSGTYYVVVTRKGKKGLITAKGKVIIRPKSYIQRIGNVSEDRIRVMKNKRWGYYDLKGKQVISARYKDARDFKNGRAAVSSGRYMTFIDNSGNAFHRTKYIDLSLSFQNSYMCKTRYGFSIYASQPQNDTICDILNPYIKTNERYYLFHPIHYSTLKEQVKGSEKQYEICFLNSKRIPTTKSFFIDAFPYEYGIARVQYSDIYKWGLINAYGVEMCNPKYDFIYSFSCERAVYRIDHFHGVMNYKGDVIHPATCINVTGFDNEIIQLQRLERNSYMDFTGKVIY